MACERLVGWKSVLQTILYSTLCAGLWQWLRNFVHKTFEFDKQSCYKIKFMQLPHAMYSAHNLYLSLRCTFTHRIAPNTSNVHEIDLLVNWRHVEHYSTFVRNVQTNRISKSCWAKRPALSKPHAAVSAHVQLHGSFEAVTEVWRQRLLASLKWFTMTMKWNAGSSEQTQP